MRLRTSLNHVRRFAACLLVTLTLPADAMPQESGAPPQGAIEGVVLAGDASESVLPDVAVEIPDLGVRTSSDEAGRFRLDDVPAGRHTLRFSLIGRAVLQRDAEVVAGRTTRLEISLAAAPVDLSPVLVLRSRTRMDEGVEGGRIPGSVQVVGEGELRTQPAVFDDVHSFLRQVPGVNVQQEDGYGLRPNIGLRGTGSERSSKITVMEDGVLAAPAPYAAPSAYYFPRAGRMHAIEVRKGSSQIRYGPNTIGGALNLVSSPIPSEFSYRVDASAGSRATGQVHARMGDSEDHFGWMVEAYRSRTDGFKQLDSGGDTGFDMQDYVGKFRLNTALDAGVYQEVELKLGWYDERSDETYLGLTDADFSTSPNRRYAASQLDVMDADHQQASLRHFVRFGSGLNLTTTGYFNAFARNWYKLQSVDDTGIAEVLSDPDTYASQLQLLRGAVDSEDGLALRANDRTYLSRGIQSALGLRLGSGVTHDLEIGVRFHWDEEDRFQQEDDYGIRNGRMYLAAAGAPGSQANRVASASAIALHATDHVRLGRLTVSPGLRFEAIDFRREDFAAGDSERRTPESVRENSVTAWIPGVGTSMEVATDVRAYAGVHRGFGPPGPGADPETESESSANFELGLEWLGDAASVEVVGFYSDYDNILGRATLASGTEGAGDVFNGGAARTWGLELAASADALSSGHDGWRLPLRFAYTLTNATFQEAFDSEFDPWGSVQAGDDLPYVPRHQVFASAGVGHGAWSGRLAATAGSAMRTVAGQGPIAPSERTDAFFVLDGGLDVQVGSALTAYAALENITDARYIVARRPAGVRPGLPRTLQVGLRLTR